MQHRVGIEYDDGDVRLDDSRSIVILGPINRCDNRGVVLVIALGCLGDSTSEFPPPVPDFGNLYPALQARKPENYRLLLLLSLYIPDSITYYYPPYP